MAHSHPRNWCSAAPSWRPRIGYPSAPLQTRSRLAWPWTVIRGLWGSWWSIPLWPASRRSGARCWVYSRRGLMLRRRLGSRLRCWACGLLVVCFMLGMGRKGEGEVPNYYALPFVAVASNVGIHRLVFGPVPRVHDREATVVRSSAHISLLAVCVSAISFRVARRCQTATASLISQLANRCFASVFLLTWCRHYFQQPSWQSSHGQCASMARTFWWIPQRRLKADFRPKDRAKCGILPLGYRGGILGWRVCLLLQRGGKRWFWVASWTNECERA